MEHHTNLVAPPPGATVTLPANQVNAWRQVLDQVRLHLHRIADDHVEELQKTDPCEIGLSVLERALQHVRIAMAAALTEQGHSIQRVDGPDDDEAGIDRADELASFLFAATSPHGLKIHRSAFRAFNTIGEAMEVRGVTQAQIVERVAHAYLERPMAEAMVERVWNLPRAEAWKMLTWWQHQETRRLREQQLEELKQYLDWLDYRYPGDPETMAANAEVAQNDLVRANRDIADQELRAAEVDPNNERERFQEHPMPDRHD